MAKKEISDVELEAVQEEIKETKTPQEKEGLYIYVGPTLSGFLKRNEVIKGRLSEIESYYGDVLEKYPKARRFIVPISELSEMKEKINTSGNIYSEYYKELSEKREG